MFEFLVWFRAPSARANPLARLPTDILGRSHRSGLGKARLAKSIAETKPCFFRHPGGLPVGIVTTSDTGDFEMAMWTHARRASRRAF